MMNKLNVLLGVVALAAATRASADITLYRGEGFRGHAETHRISRTVDRVDVQRARRLYGKVPAVCREFELRCVLSL